MSTQLLATGRKKQAVTIPQSKPFVRRRKEISGTASQKKAIRLSLKDALDFAQKKDSSKASESLSKTSSLLDKAAKKGFMHWKAVARKKSYLARRVSGSLNSSEAKTASAAA